MAPLFGPSASDLEHLRSTVRALGKTSVPGLSAALSWRERKTEKLLAHELARPNTPLAYDPARRTVRWTAATPPVRADAPRLRRRPRPPHRRSPVRRSLPLLRTRRRGSRYAAHIVRSPSSRRGPTAWSCVPSADDSRARAVGASPTRPRLRLRPCRP